MTYDIFTQDEKFAFQLGKELGKNPSSDELDLGSEELEFSFFDLTESELRELKRTLYENASRYTIRLPKNNGEIIWPRKDGLSIDKVLDL